MKTPIRRRIRPPAFATAALLLLAVAGCGIISTEDDVKVDFSGPFSSQVHACVALAAAGNLRNDPSTPTGLKVDRVEIDQGRADENFFYSVSGRLIATFGYASSAEYEWTCEVRHGEIDGRPSLTAVLLTFAPG